MHYSKVVLYVNFDIILHNHNKFYNKHFEQNDIYYKSHLEEHFLILMFVNDSINIVQ